MSDRVAVGTGSVVDFTWVTDGDWNAFRPTIRDLGLTWNQALEAGGVLVGNQIRITLDVRAVQASG